MPVLERLRHPLLQRWAAPLAAGLAFAGLLGLGLALRTRGAEAGLTVLIGSALKTQAVRVFARTLVVTLLLPFYLGAALLLWALTLAWASALRSGLARTWTPGQGFALTSSALLWVHLNLWWQVPASLWLLPGLARIPFLVLFPLLLLLSLAYPLHWLRRQHLGWPRAGTLLAGWLGLWALLAWAPTALPRPAPASQGGSAPARFLVIGLDGLRGDVGQAATANYLGSPYPNTYTVVPATRLVWSMLWGGDPLAYSVSHVFPELQELKRSDCYPLLNQAQAQGWKPRFYMDDGGTIGLVGRQLPFDDLLMPAPGWESFVNSNLAASFPLLAAWENWGRAFPTTNPWAPLDGGLKEALRLGRGSQWVMFHSCLAHAPIFLRRNELAQIPRWWTLAPADLEPYAMLSQVTRARISRWDPRRDPELAYTLRMRSILQAWEPIWNGLARDPDYRGATRILFSDHGERFYPVTPTLHLGGVHGYNLDPWETRAMLKVAGPGFPETPGPARPATISLLALRDGFARALASGAPVRPESLEQAYPEAPMRYQCLDLDLFTQEPARYRQLPTTALAHSVIIAPGGLWFTEEPSSPELRAKDAAVGWGRAGDLEVFRPLVEGGAHRYRYHQWQLMAIDTVSEQRYAQEQAKAVQVLSRPTAVTQR